MLDKNFVAKVTGVPFSDSHGAKGQFLGAGSLYYSLAYSLKAKLCVCLGSGGGFVPALMRKGQLDASVANSATYLVDGDTGPLELWGRPCYYADPNCFLRADTDVRLIKKLTSQSIEDFRGRNINYLHIDADHSYEGCKADFDMFRHIVVTDGVITFHDTNSHILNPLCGVHKVLDYASSVGWRIVDFPTLGNGVAIARRA